MKIDPLNFESLRPYYIEPEGPYVKKTPSPRQILELPNSWPKLFTFGHHLPYSGSESVLQEMLENLILSEKMSVTVLTIVSMTVTFPHHCGTSIPGSVIAKKTMIVQMIKPESSPAAVM